MYLLIIRGVGVQCLTNDLSIVFLFVIGDVQITILGDTPNPVYSILEVVVVLVPIGVHSCCVYVGSCSTIVLLGGVVLIYSRAQGSVILGYSMFPSFNPNVKLTLDSSAL